MHPSAPRFVSRLTVLSAAVMTAFAAQAAVTVDGNIGTDPASVLGPGDTTLPGTVAWVGTSWGGNSVGSLTVDNGSFLSLARLSFGAGGGLANGTGLVTGNGTQVQLVGIGNFNQTQRLIVGDWGNGQLTVSAGASLSTRGNQATCLQAFHYCDSFVGAAAGDNATLNVTGAGTQVLIGQSLFVAQPGLAVQGLDGYTYGTPGGTTRGTVNVTGGALLSTDRATIGPRHWSTNATGFERNIAEVNVSGAGSRWLLTGGQQVLNHATGAVGEGGAGFVTANDSNAWATIRVSDGGVIEVKGPNGYYSYVNLTSTGTSRSGLAGGRTDMVITGAGSQLLFSGDAGVLQVGRALGSASLSILDGATVDGAYYLSVGRDGSVGNLLIDGTGSKANINGTASAAANGVTATAFIDIGRNGTGSVTVRNGGQLLLDANQASTSGPGMNLGRGAASSGTLNIEGNGSVVRLTSQSVLPGGGSGETWNPVVRVGREGSGFLNISGGGKLLIEGGGVSTPANRRNTALIIGGVDDATDGGRGVANVSGLGSEIRVTGGDTFIGVGIGPQSNGQLTLSNQALVRSIGINVGRSGGVGVLKLDNGKLEFSGQQTGGTLSGSFFSLGHGGGIGVATITNGSTVTLTNLGTSGAAMSLGGSGNFAGGDGSLTLSGASRIDVIAAPGLGSVTVGREGSALMRVRGGSTVDVGDGSVYVGRFSGSDGTLLVSEGSTINAGWVGVGRRRTDTGSVDGGTGTFVLNNSTLNAPTIVIGTNGFLGGNGVINGNVTNFGIFAPGNSPGTMEITGSFVAEAGSRLILEIESDGLGGFNTDKLIFGNGQTVDLANLNVEFRFLGTTDPNAFEQANLFDVDTFFQMRTASGGTQDLAPDLFATAKFDAKADAFTITNFSFSATDGASFTATPVPEPSTWGLMFAGLCAVGAIARRRKAQAAQA